MFIWTEDDEAINTDYIVRLRVENTGDIYESNYRLMADMIGGGREYIFFSEWLVTNEEQAENALKDLVQKLNKEKKC